MKQLFVSMLSVVIAVGMSVVGIADALPSAKNIVLNCGNGKVIIFSGENGSILGIGDNESFRSGKDGLWLATNAKQSVAANSGKFSWVEKPQQHQLIFTYEHPALTCTVTIKGSDYGVDFTASLAPHGNFTVEKFYLPGRIMFSPDRIDRVIMPDGGMDGIGFSFLPAFFQQSAKDQPCGWERVRANDDAYKFLFGAAMPVRPYLDPAIPLKVTNEGEKWLPDWFVTQLNKTMRSVNRACGRNQVDLVLVDSANGPFFSASRFGGKGALWRFGSFQQYLDTCGTVPRYQVPNIFVESVSGVIGKLTETKPEKRNIIAVIDLVNGPEVGLHSHTTVSVWRERMQKIAKTHSGYEYISLKTPEEVINALESERVLALVNPYGEAVPVSSGGYKEMMSAIKKFVIAGGNWFDTAGLSFYWDFKPKYFNTYESIFPNSFADFMQLDGKDNQVAFYAVQPLDPQPWAGMQDHSKIFVVGNLACGGEANNGWMERYFVTHVKPNTSWKSPVVRIRFGTATDNLNAYNRDNRIDKTLDQKLPADVLKRLKDAPMVKFEAFCRFFIESLPYLPVPSLIHYDRHLRYGYDKGYPDHLPPTPEKFGTPEEYMTFLRRAKQMGHFTMPYSNSSFWCENPRGETFKREGEVGLLRKADGTLNLEAYGHSDNPNTGYSTTLWHPVIRKANQETVRQFKDDYPVDFLFQDQIGARATQYDWNPASPTVYAYTAGLMAQAAEDSQRMPLATEGGFAHLLNYETMLYGLSFGLVPTDRRGSARLDYMVKFAPQTWRIYPMVQILSHDKVILHYHDHIAFVSNAKTLSWTLGLGFSINYIPKQWGAFRVKEPAEQGWLFYLAEIQKNVIAPSLGQPVKNFIHQRDRNNNDGTIEATYGPLAVWANLDPWGREMNGRQIAPYGYYAITPEMVSGILQQVGQRKLAEPAWFISRKDGDRVRVSVYARAGQVAAAELPVPARNFRQIRLEDGRVIPCETQGNSIYFTAPAKPDTPVECVNCLVGTLE